MHVNSITQDFNMKVQALINDGSEPEEIINKLNWNPTPFSLVRNSKRNVPPEKYDLFKKVFNIEKEAPKQEAPQTTLEQKYVARLEEDILHLKQHNDVLREKVDASLATVIDNQTVMLSLMESAIVALSEHLCGDDEEAKRDFRSRLHKDAIERWKGYKKTGSRVNIHNVDTVFSE